MNKKTVEIYMSPVKLSSPVFIRDERGLMTSYKIGNKDLVEFMAKQENVGEVTIAGPKVYTSRFRDQMSTRMNSGCKFVLRSK